MAGKRSDPDPWRGALSVLVLCGRCATIRGARGGLRQRCRCEADADERWPRYDYNTHTELCYCCAAAAIESGSRWSSFFCDRCRERVLDFDRRQGRWIVPLGRHSAMHGDLLGGAEAGIREHAEELAARIRTLGGGIDHLRRWATERTRHNLDTAGFRAGADVPLPAYLAAVAESDKREAFEGLVRHFGGEP
ncbi:MAG TPA: hypothetical protein VFA66_12925 [Gaiellaceae bacterium]|nr:hypothetical protein [Gaiellaceae bacterium]